MNGDRRPRGQAGSGSVQGENPPEPEPKRQKLDDQDPNNDPKNQVDDAVKTAATTTNIHEPLSFEEEVALWDRFLGAGTDDDTKMTSPIPDDQLILLWDIEYDSSSGDDDPKVESVVRGTCGICGAIDKHIMVACPYLDYLPEDGHIVPGAPVKICSLLGGEVSEGEKVWGPRRVILWG